MKRPRSPDDLLDLTEAAMVVALVITLGNLRLLQLPNGGSISFGPLPLLAFALARGPRSAALAGWCAGLGHALFGAMIVHPLQLLLDYGLSYAAFATAGLVPAARHSRQRMLLAVLVGCAAHLAVVTVSGAVFFASYAGAASPIAYSLAYNASTAVPVALLAAWLVPAFVRAHERATTSRSRLARPTPTRGSPNPGTLRSPHLQRPVAAPAPPAQPAVSPRPAARAGRRRRGFSDRPPPFAAPSSRHRAAGASSLVPQADAGKPGHQHRPGVRGP